MWREQTDRLRDRDTYRGTNRERYTDKTKQISIHTDGDRKADIFENR